MQQSEPGVLPVFKVELAASARKDTEAALAADPENDLAHHLMGRWHTEMAQVRQGYCTLWHADKHPSAAARNM